MNDEVNVDISSIIAGLRNRLSQSIYNNCILEARVSKLQDEVYRLQNEVSVQDAPAEKVAGDNLVQVSD